MTNQLLLNSICIIYNIDINYLTIYFLTIYDPTIFMAS